MSLPRRILGLLCAAVTALIALAAVAGAWNPWRSVLLERFFGNPPRSLFVLAVAVFVTARVLAPVRNEAVQVGRLRWRVASAVTALVALLGWGLFGVWFATETEEVARSDDGSRTLVVVHRPASGDRQVRVWAGRGLWTRDVGSLGRACGQVRARFLHTDRVEVRTSYGTWQFDLEPGTGAPLDGIGPRCTGR